jgi:hypothetical protein
MVMAVFPDPLLHFIILKFCEFSPLMAFLAADNAHPASATAFGAVAHAELTTDDGNLGNRSLMTGAVPA